MVLTIDHFDCRGALRHDQKKEVAEESRTLIMAGGHPFDHFNMCILLGSLSAF